MRTRDLVRFELRRVIDRSGAAIGAALFLALTVMGHWDQIQGTTARGPSEMFVFAVAIGLIPFLSLGTAEDRSHAFDEYLIVNHVIARDYHLAKILAMTIGLIGYAVAAGTIEALFAGSGWAVAAWQSVVVWLAALLLLPYIAVVEYSIDTSIPAAPVLLLYGIAVAIAFLATESRALVDATGLSQLKAGDWQSLGPLLWRAAASVLVGFLAAEGLHRLRLRRY